MNKFHILTTENFDRNVKKILRKNKSIKQKIIKIIEILSEDPFSSSLNTHKVNSPMFGLTYSSKVTPDLRIIWSFSKAHEITIILLDFGGHDDVY